MDGKASQRGNPEPALDGASRRRLRATLGRDERRALREAALGRSMPDGGWVAALVAEEAIWLRRWLGVANAVCILGVVLSVLQWVVTDAVPLQLLVFGAALALNVPRRGAAKRAARAMREVGDVGDLERRAAAA